MDKNLQKIANTLILNQHNIGNIGLLNGKLGIAIFLFHYSRLKQSNTYNEYAEEILDNVISDIERRHTFPNFEDGICGISWGLDYLIKNAFIEGDINEILADTDDLMLTTVDAESYANFARDTPLFDIGLYFCLRINDPQYEGDTKLADDILNSIQVILETETLLKVSLLNSILYTVNKINHIFDTSIDRVASIRSRINKKLVESIEAGMYNNVDLIIMERLYLEGYMLFIDIERKKDDDSNALINCVWLQLLYGIEEPLYKEMSVN
jgi:hypothetical protein